MKKLLGSLLMTFISVTALCQFPNNPTQSAVHTNTNFLGAVTGQKGIVGGVYTDTTAANLVTYMKGVPGIIIYTTSTNEYWYRNSTATGWTKFASGTISTPTWQQTLTAGSTLTGDNIIGGGGTNFTWANMGTWTLQNGATNSIIAVSDEIALGSPIRAWSQASDPSVNNQGDIYFNTVDERFRGSAAGGVYKNFLMDGDVTNGWGLTGNSGTTAGNFIGTTDNVDLGFKRNGIEVGKFFSDKLRVSDLNKTNGYEFGSSLSQAQPSSSVSSSIWSLQSSAVRTEWWDGCAVVSNHDTLFVLGGWKTGPTVTDSIHYSVDNGVTWVGYAGKLPFAVHSMPVIHSPDGWIYMLGGDAYSTATQRKSVYRTRDLITWTLLTSDYGGGERILGGGFSDDFGNIYWVGGQSGINGGGLNDIWKSTDGGATWTQAASGISVAGDSFLGKNISNAVVYFNGRIYVVGGGVYDEGTPANFTYTKSVHSADLYDLSTWKAESNLPFAGGRQYNSVAVWDGKIWSVGGFNGVANTDSVGYMNAAGTWALFNAPVGTNPSASHADGIGIHNGNLFYVLGNTTNNAYMLSRSNDLFVGDQIIAGNLIGSGIRMTYAESGGNIEAGNTIALTTPLQLGVGSVLYPTATGYSSFSSSAAATNGINITNTSSTGYMQNLLAQTTTSFGGVWRWNTGYVGNYTGTSFPFAASIQVGSGSGGDEPLVLSANPIISNGGITSTNAAFRMDNIGLKIGTNADVHTAGTAKLHNIGTVRFESLGAGVGTQALRIDASGNVTYADTTISSLSGSGTLNFVPKWTPSGTVLGNSSIYDDGTNVGINKTSSFAAKLDVLGSGTAALTMAARFVGGTSAAAGGLQLGSYSSTYGGIWSNNVTPTLSNFSLITNGAETYVNGTSAFYLTANTNQTTTTTSNTTFTKQIVNSSAGAASTPAVSLTGAIFTGGTGTTTHPLLLIQPTGATAVTTWSTAGTGLGINSGSGFTGNFADFHVNGGASVFSVGSTGAITSGLINATGNITASGSIYAGAGGGMGPNGSARTQLYSSSDGNLTLYNAAFSGFTQLNLGPPTSSFPALRVNGTGIDIKLADNSAYTTLRASNLSAGAASSALLTIGAGTATANTAPVKLTTGTLNTVIVGGQLEYNNAHYLSNSALNRFAPGGAIADFITTVDNGTTVETDLYTYTTKASTLAADGEKLSFKVAGTFNDLTATAQLQFYFAGSSIGNTGALTVSATGGWNADVFLIRTSSTTVRAVVTVNTPGASTALYTTQTDVAGLTLSNTNILKITGTAGGASGGTGDISAKLGTITWLGAANN